MNLWVIQQTATGTRKWKLEPRKQAWVLGTSREASLRVHSGSSQSEIFGSFDFKNDHWQFTRLTAPDNQSNIQRNYAILEATEISFDNITFRVVPLKDKAAMLGTNIKSEIADQSLLKNLMRELSSFKMKHFFDSETSPFLGSALGACFILLLFISLVKKPEAIKDENKATALKTIEIKTEIFAKPKALAQAIKNSVAPKQKHTAAAAGTVKNSKQVIGAIFSKIQGRSLQKVLKNVTLTASSKNVVSGVLAKTLSTYSKNIPDGRQLAAVGSGAGTALGTIGVNTVGTTGKGGVAGIGKMDHGDVGNAKIGLLPDESDVQGGLAREVISNYIQTKLGPILYCYERQLSANPSLYGKVAVRFSIKADGFVDHSEISETTLKSQSVETCLLSQVNQWKFPKPEGGLKVVVTYPFMFKSIN
jgi:hypothetical protein